MAEFEELPHCCGIHELGLIVEDESAVETLRGVWPFDLSAHVIFSVTSRETANHKRGMQLAALIRKNKLGTVVSTKPARNPGHTGTLKAWIWTPDVQKLLAWQRSFREPDVISRRV